MCTNPIGPNYKAKLNNGVVVSNEKESTIGITQMTIKTMSTRNLMKIYLMYINYTKYKLIHSDRAY